MIIIRALSHRSIVGVCVAGQQNHDLTAAADNGPSSSSSLLLSTWLSKQTVLSKRIQIDPRLFFFSLFSKCPHVSKRPQQPDKTCQQYIPRSSHRNVNSWRRIINLLVLFYLSRWLWTDLVLSKFHFWIPGNKRMKWIICWMMEDSSFYMASDRIVIIVIQRMIGYNTWTKVFVGRF